MRMPARRTVSLGELVVAVFDLAASYSDHPRVVSRLATEAVTGLLQRARTRGMRVALGIGHEGVHNEASHA